VSGVDGEIGTSALRSCLAIGSGGFLLGVYLLANLLPQRVIGRALRAGFLIVGAGLGATMAWALLDYTPSGELSFERRSLEGLAVGTKMLFDYLPSREPSAERRSLEVRAEQLNAQAIASGSPLACLDALTGEAVENACEKELFASAASVAAAASFVAHRLELLAAVLTYDKRRPAEIDGLLRPLRRSLEADRFGFLAHVLALRDGCTSENCKALALLDDPARVRTNLSAQTFDHHIEHYAEIWAKPPNGSHEAPDGPVVGAIQPSGPPSHKIADIDFPTAASIPAVSIMTPEPTGPVLARAATNTNPQQASAPAARRIRKSAASASSPQTLGQPAAANAGTTEPIWLEPVPPPRAATATAASGSAQPPNGSSTAPVQ
jgi:hypothetical protein